MVRALCFRSSSISAKSCAGKNWHQPKAAFRPSTGLTSYEKRKRKEAEATAMKNTEKVLKKEKEEQRERWIQGIKDKRAAKEEKARYEKMAEKMHQKRVDRLKRREKRNKLLKS